MNRAIEDIKDEGFIERMLEIIKLTGGENALSAKSGVSRPSIDKYKSGSDPSRGYLIKMADAAGVSVEWLATGKGNKNADTEGNFIRIEVYKTRVSAGGGAAVYYDEVGDYFPMSRLWIERHHLHPKDLFIIWGVGDSMDPLIISGEKLLCSKSDHHKRGDGIFVIRQDGDLLLKRLQRLPDNIIRVHSSNPAYSTYDIKLDKQTDFEIIGRVLYKDTLHRVS